MISIQELSNRTKNHPLIIHINPLGLLRIEKNNIKCEPQLGKRNLYPTISRKSVNPDLNTRMDLLAYTDGSHSLFDISVIIRKNLGLVVSEAIILKNNNLISF
jgi:aminopeptidase-like protein